MPNYTQFLLLLQQITTKLVAETTQMYYLLFSKLEVPQGKVLWESQGRICFPAFSSFLRLPTFLNFGPFSSSKPSVQLLFFCCHISLNTRLLCRRQSYQLLHFLTEIVIWVIYSFSLYSNDKCTHWFITFLCVCFSPHFIF